MAAQKRRGRGEVPNLMKHRGEMWGGCLKAWGLQGESEHGETQGETRRGVQADVCAYERCAYACGLVCHLLGPACVGGNRHDHPRIE